jgi:O-antigen ligase
MIQDGISVSNTGNTGGTVNITLNLSSSNNNTKSYLFRYYIIDITGNTFNFTNSYTIFNNSISTNSSISESIRNANFSTGGGIILAVIITVVVLLVMSTFIAGAFLGVVLGIIAITLSALTLIPWTFGIMIALIMFFSAWARGR